MKEITKTKKIIYGLLIAIAVIVVAVVAVTSLYPSFYLKGGKIAIEVGEEFDALSQISGVRNLDIKDIEIVSKVNNLVPGTYEVTYKYLTKTETIVVTVEDRDYPIFSIRDGVDYYMSTEFDINSVVVDITDKTGVTSFTWKETTGGLGVPGIASLDLTASDAYGHTTVNVANVNVIDDVLPVITLKSVLNDVEAGDSFDPMIFVESATDNYMQPVISYEITSGSLQKVGKVKAVIYATDSSGNVAKAEVSFKTVDTTAPVITEKTGTHVYKMSQKLDPFKYIEVTDNTEKTKTNYEIISGSLTEVGTVEIAVNAEDDYGNISETKIISVEVQDDIPPVFELTRESYTIALGRYFDLDAIIKSASDNCGGKIKFSYEVSSGTLKHAGTCQVDIIATDQYGNSSKITVPVTSVDQVAPTLVVNTDKIFFILGEEFKMEDYIISCTDNDEVTSITMEIASGSMEELGDTVIAVTATDPSGNTTTKELYVRVKARVYQDFGTELNVEITGRDNQPYLIAVNRYMGVVTVYGKDENGDYTVPVKAMLCSVGKNSELEENFGVRSGNGLTPLGVYDTIGKTDTGWGTLYSNDNYHTYVYGQYTTRIVGHILFHSVPYFWQRKDALEWTGTLDNLNHEFNKLGSPASMGCIRLCVADVKWIWDNCPVGATTVIYDERDDYGPLGRPENFIIDPTSEMFADVDPEILGVSGYYKDTFKTNPNASLNPLNWDPTDPDPNNPWIPILEAWEQKQKEQEVNAGEEGGQTE